MGLEMFLIAVHVPALIVMILSEELTEILATVVLVFTALMLTIVDVFTGDALGAALWGFNTGIQLLSLGYRIIRYKNY